MLRRHSNAQRRVILTASKGGDAFSLINYAAWKQNDRLGARGLRIGRGYERQAGGRAVQLASESHAWCNICGDATVRQQRGSHEASPDSSDEFLPRTSVESASLRLFFTPVCYSSTVPSTFRREKSSRRPCLFPFLFYLQAGPCKLLALFSPKPETIKTLCYCCNFPHGVAENRVDPLSPPEEATVGELITFPGVLSAPSPPGSAAARAWSAAMEGMKTRAPDGVASWEDLAMETSCGGACTSSVLGRVR